MNATIRDARPDDRDAIASIEAAAASHPWSTDAIAATLALPTTIALVVEADGVAGHLLASAAVDEGEVLTVAVLPDRRRAGLGRALLRACSDRWRARGVHTAFLEVREDNDAARALYAAEGWRPVGARRGYYADGTNAVVYRRELA